MRKRILLTGGLGFIGSHTVEHYLLNTDWDLIVLDSLRHSGRAERLADMPCYDPRRVTVVWQDLNYPITQGAMKEIGHIDYIVNMASESHVDRSIQEPISFIQNNVALVLNMLEYAKQIQPEVFIQVSTDEVFGSAEEGVMHSEAGRLRPSNPYSASKAAQELIAFSYWRTYGVPVIITNTMNNFGERQDLEKFFPMTVRKIIKGEPNLIHADLRDGNWHSGSRVWLHARNHADAIKFIIEKVKPLHYADGHLVPERFNISGDNEITNEEIVSMIGEILDIEPEIEFFDYHSTRPGHDLRYCLDGSKMREYGWTMPVSTKDSFEKTVNWYRRNRYWLSAK